MKCRKRQSKRQVSAEDRKPPAVTFGRCLPPDKRYLRVALYRQTFNQLRVGPQEEVADWNTAQTDTVCKIRYRLSHLSPPETVSHGSTTQANGSPAHPGVVHLALLCSTQSHNSHTTTRTTGFYQTFALAGSHKCCGRIRARALPMLIIAIVAKVIAGIRRPASAPINIDQRGTRSK